MKPAGTGRTPRRVEAGSGTGSPWGWPSRADQATTSGADVDGQRRDEQRRTRIVSIRMPTATITAVCTDGTSGSTVRAANVAASTTPALVMTPPVTVSA